MNVSLSTLSQASRRAKVWLVPVFEGRVSESAKQFGFDPAEPRAWSFDGQMGRSLTVPLTQRRAFALLVGAGKRASFDCERARQVIANAVRHRSVQKAQAATVLFVATGLDSSRFPREVLAESLAEGAVLGGYAFTQLKAKGTPASKLPSPPRRLVVAFDTVRQRDRERFKDGSIMATWTNWGRDLLNLPQSHLTATRLANVVRRTAAALPTQVKCTVWGPKEIAKARMGLLLAVNKGSTEPPRFITLQYSGGRRGAAPICLVGKGLTYDTGGYNLKPGDSMRGMHMDKGGAIGVLASFFAAVALRVPHNLVCLVPSTDNCISGSAMVPGDVYTGLSEISVEVDNTDAEGRMVLADALAYAKRFKPSHIVDMATLTGAAVVALGDQASAMFCSDDALAGQLLKHADDAGELLWRMPLWEAYEEKLKSKVADIRNVGDRWGGAVTAALFLKRFVPDGVLWCHLDIAGKMSASRDFAYTPSGSGFGFGPRLIARWLRG